jgi:hypothetical protein
MRLLRNRKVWLCCAVGVFACLLALLLVSSLHTLAVSADGQPPTDTPASHQPTQSTNRPATVAVITPTVTATPTPTATPTQVPPVVPPTRDGVYAALAFCQLAAPNTPPAIDVSLIYAALGLVVVAVLVYSIFQLQRNSTGRAISRGGAAAVPAAATRGPGSPSARQIETAEGLDERRRNSGRTSLTTDVAIAILLAVGVGLYLLLGRNFGVQLGVATLAGVVLLLFTQSALLADRGILTILTRVVAVSTPFAYVVVGALFQGAQSDLMLNFLLGSLLALLTVTLLSGGRLPLVTAAAISLLLALLLVLFLATNQITVPQAQGCSRMLSDTQMGLTLLALVVFGLNLIAAILALLARFGPGIQPIMRPILTTGRALYQEFPTVPSKAVFSSLAWGFAALRQRQAERRVTTASDALQVADGVAQNLVGVAAVASGAAGVSTANGARSGSPGAPGSSGSSEAGLTAWQALWVRVLVATLLNLFRYSYLGRRGRPPSLSRVRGALNRLLAGEPVTDTRTLDFVAGTLVDASEGGPTLGLDALLTVLGEQVRPASRSLSNLTPESLERVRGALAARQAQRERQTVSQRS